MAGWRRYACSCEQEAKISVLLFHTNLGVKNSFAFFPFFEIFFIPKWV